MTIGSTADLIAGFRPTQSFYKTTGAMKAAGVNHSCWYAAGFPGAGSASSAGVAGEALSSSSSQVPGQIPFPSPVVGKEVRLGRLEGLQTSSVGAFMLADRLWQNSGLSVTSTGSQAVNSVALPARDRDLSTNGRGVLVALEVSSTLGVGTPTITIGYTNSDGVSGRTGTIGPLLTTSSQGTVYLMAMQAGDVGVRSIQSFQSSATMTSGSVQLIMYREIATLPLPASNFSNDRNAMELGIPVVPDGAVPFLVVQATGTTSTLIDGSLNFAQG